MGLLGKLFSSPKNTSQLESFIKNITLDHALDIYENASNPDLRLPMAISMTILYITHQFCEGFLKMEGDLGKSTRTPNHQRAYDAIAFEAAAFSHFWLMKEYLQADLDRMECDDEDDDFDGDRDPRHSDLVSSAIINDGLLSRYTDFGLPDKFFVRRSFSYCQSNDIKIDIQQLMDRFEHKLHCSILAGKPIQQKQRQLGHLELDLTLKAYIPIFVANSLPALSETVERLFVHSENQ